jgi:hypothetical protein
MTHPIRTSRVVLLQDTREAAPRPPVRRYRLARLRFDGPSAEPETRFEYLKRVYD